MPHDGKDGVHWHEPAGAKKAGFGEFKKQPTPYDAWMESEGIPVFRGIGIGSSGTQVIFSKIRLRRQCSI